MKCSICHQIGHNKRSCKNTKDINKITVLKDMDDADTIRRLTEHLTLNVVNHEKCISTHILYHK